LQALVNADGRMAGFDRQLSTALADLDTLQQGVTTSEATEYSQQRMERDIWILWMGTLSDDNHNILDLDAIEDHLHQIGVLGAGSDLGIDFGSYTSDSEETAALAAARSRAQQIRTRSRQLEGPTVRTRP
jgi:hypothetical protein